MYNTTPYIFISESEQRRFTNVIATDVDGELPLSSMQYLLTRLYTFIPDDNKCETECEYEYDNDLLTEYLC